MEHVYVAVLPVPLGPLADEHGAGAPDGLVTVQVTVPVGVDPDPVTVAVKMRVPPVEMLEVLSATDTVGAALAMSAVSSVPEAPP
jgi:hypothetical protein